MDVVNFWQKQVAKWNEESKCGLCWNFGAPLIDSQANIQQHEEACCVSVMITNLWDEKNVNFVNQTVWEANKVCRFGFTLFVGVPSSFGVNNYNEILHHPIDESRWETIFKPLQECLGCELVLDECAIQGYLFKNTLWRKELRMNHTDMNLAGWKITAIFEE